MSTLKDITQEVTNRQASLSDPTAQQQSIKEVTPQNENALLDPPQESRQRHHLNPTSDVRSQSSTPSSMTRLSTPTSGASFGSKRFGWRKSTARFKVPSKRNEHEMLKTQKSKITPISNVTKAGRTVSLHKRFPSQRQLTA